MTDWASVKGEKSWTSSNGQKIYESFEVAIPALIEMSRHDFSAAQTSEAVEYTVINGKTPQRGLGWILEKRDSQILIESKMIPNTVISFPESVMQIKEKEGKEPLQ